MTQINLPNRNITGDNLWSQVEDNDDAIVDVVNGAIDNGNIATGADINASKLLDGSISAAKLGTDSVTNAKINAGAVDTAEIADDAVTADKLRDDASTDGNRAVTTNHIRDNAVTGAKIAASTTATATNSSGVTGTLTARKYADGLVVLQGPLTRSGVGDLATLPVGYRPSDTIVVPIGTTASTGTATLTAAGSLSSTIGGTISLSHLSFHAA